MYRFVREDNGKEIVVDFLTMMDQDASGRITLDDGTRARRVQEPEVHRAPVDPQNANQAPPVSDAMGFPIHQFAEFEYDRTQNAFHGVEFKPDPACPEFMQVHFASHRDRDRYMKHRGMVDRNKTAGAALSKKDLEDAAKYAKNIGK